MILDSATHRVTLTYPAGTLEGDPLYRPSISVRSRGITRNRRFSMRCRARHVPMENGGQGSRREWQRGALPEDRASVLLGEDIVRRAKLESKGVMRARLGKGVLPLDGVWHPSELNALSSCPFVFLARHRLNIRSAEIPDFEVPAQEIGMLAHVILRDFHAQPVPSSAMKRARA